MEILLGILIGSSFTALAWTWSVDTRSKAELAKLRKEHDSIYGIEFSRLSDHTKRAE